MCDKTMYREIGDNDDKTMKDIEEENKRMDRIREQFYREKHINGYP